MKPGNLHVLLKANAKVLKLMQGKFPWMIRVKGAFKNYAFPHV